MSKQKKPIPNPNKMSNLEREFTYTGNLQAKESDTLDKKATYKGRMISMPDSFFHKLNNYLKNNPTEGNRSSFIVRVVAEYMDKKIRNS